MYLQNLHTHIVFCDGADMPEEMILTAIDKGFDSLGFSGHSFMACSPVFAKMGDRTEQYKQEIIELKEKYKEQLKIYLGLEVEPYSGADMTGYDYLIASIHYLKFEDGFVPFDRNADFVKKLIDERFGGDGMAYTKAYYKAMSEIPNYGNFDIIGHFDIITKHIDNSNFFDYTSKEYLNAAFEAAEALRGKIPFFEVNTGAVSRGYRKTPYPSIPIIKELKRLGYGVVITSDCHQKDALDCYFDEAAELLRFCGFKEKYILTDNGFKGVEL